MRIIFVSLEKHEPVQGELSEFGREFIGCLNSLSGHAFDDQDDARRHQNELPINNRHGVILTLANELER